MAERVEIIISATDQTTGVVNKITGNMTSAFKGVGQSITNTGKQISDVGKSLTAWTAPIAIIGGFGLKTFANFEDVLAEIAARTGATGDEMDIVKQKALDMGAATVFSGTEAADAMLQLLASGFDLEETFAALPAVLDAAAAGALDLGYTADVVTDALAMWNLGAEESTRISDALARGAGASSAEINDLAQGLSNVGPIAAEFGLSIEDTVAVLAAFSERGIKGAEAGTQLRSMMTNMTRDTEKVTGMWDQLGISLFDAKGEMRPLQDVMANLRGQMVSMTDEERINTIKTLGGAYGQMGLSVLTSSGAMEGMLGLMDEQADAATVAQARMGTLSGVTESLMGSVESLMINALEPLIENTLKPLILTAIEVTNKINEWAQANPVLVEQITQVAAAAVALGPILFGVGKGIQLIGIMITVLTSPIALVAAAIAAFAYAYINNIGGLRDFTQDKVIPTIQGFISVLGSVWKAVKPELEKLAEWFISDALPAIVSFIHGSVIPALTLTVAWLKKIWEDAKPLLQELALWFLDDALPAIVDFTVNTVIPAIQDLIKFLSDVWDVAGPKLQQVGEWFLVTAMPEINRFLMNSVLPTIGWIVDKLVAIWDVAGPKLQEFYNWVSTSLLWLLNNVFTPVYNVVFNITGAIGDMVDAIADIDLGILEDAANFFGGVIDTGLGLIGKKAQGGPFQGLAMVGEEGRELVYAPGGAMVLPNGQSEQIVNNFNLTTNSAATSAGVESDFRMMEAFA
jgi:TP901 family phage tail tape measure protein